MGILYNMEAYGGLTKEDIYTDPKHISLKKVEGYILAAKHTLQIGDEPHATSEGIVDIEIIRRLHTLFMFV